MRNIDGDMLYNYLLADLKYYRQQKSIHLECENFHEVLKYQERINILKEIDVKIKHGEFDVKGD